MKQDHFDAMLMFVTTMCLVSILGGCLKLCLQAYEYALCYLR